jgi:hypothetical protein
MTVWNKKKQMTPQPVAQDNEIWGVVIQPVLPENEEITHLTAEGEEIDINPEPVDNLKAIGQEMLDELDKHVTEPIPGHDDPMLSIGHFHLDSGCVKCRQHVAQHHLGLMTSTFDDNLSRLALNMDSFENVTNNMMSSFIQALDKFTHTMETTVSRLEEKITRVTEKLEEADRFVDSVNTLKLKDFGWKGLVFGAGSAIVGGIATLLIASLF